MEITFKIRLSYGLFFFFCISAVLSSALGQKESKGTFKRRLELSNQAPLPFESLGVLAAVLNDSGDRHTEVRSWDTFLYWSHQTTDPLRWIRYLPDSEPTGDPSDPKPLTLNPGETLTWTRHLD
jgi:hypothetical protein